MTRPFWDLLTKSAYLMHFIWTVTILMPFSLNFLSMIPKISLAKFDASWLNEAKGFAAKPLDS